MPFQKGNQLWLKRKNNKGHKPTFQRPHTEEEKHKISETLKRVGYPKSMLGKHHSEETKRNMSLSRKGNQNGNWKGGLTELIEGIRRSPENYQWRKAVLERDNHTCQDCGATENLEAHHIRAVMDYPKRIFEVENGLTICEDCHKRHTSWLWLKKKGKVKH